MTERTHSIAPLHFCLAAVFALHLVSAVPAYGDSGKSSGALLAAAKEVIAENSDTFIVQDKAEVLVAKLSILESQSDVRSALVRARSIKSPFYSSLALCGIAATEIPSDPSTSAKHFREALARSGDVKQWTGSYATSLGLIFGLLPSYPRKEAHELLEASKEAFDAWGGSDCQRSQALLALSEVTAALGPDGAKGLLYSVALKSNHYWDSIEYLATAMARQSMEQALELSEKHYAAKRDWPNDQYFRRAVLIELARTDFPRAFAGIKAMRKLDQEIAAVTLAEFLLDEERRSETRQVVAHIESLRSDFNWTQSSLTKLRSRLEQAGQGATPSVAVTPEAIADFLQSPNAGGLQSFLSAGRMVFGDERQVRDFVSTSLPLVEAIRDRGYPYHGSPRSTALGLLAVCSALLDEVPQALRISKRIAIPELRASCLLDAYEVTHPVPATVSRWPIHFGQHKTIQIQSRRVATSATVAAALLLEHTKPSGEVEQALATISEYADSKTRSEKTIRIADGSRHTAMLTRYPVLGIAVRHYDQKFSGAFRIENETSNSRAVRGPR